MYYIFQRFIYLFWFAKQLNQVGGETKQKHHNSLLKFAKEMLL
jgi:hypothetical protein